MELDPDSLTIPHQFSDTFLYEDDEDGTERHNLEKIPKVADQVVHGQNQRQESYNDNMVFYLFM